MVKVEWSVQLRGISSLVLNIMQGISVMYMYPRGIILTPLLCADCVDAFASNVTVFAEEYIL